MHNLLGKDIRGRFGFPSGVITTNSDVAKWMFAHVPQFGFYQGKSTTIEMRSTLWNACATAEPVSPEVAVRMTSSPPSCAPASSTSASAASPKLTA